MANFGQKLAAWAVHAFTASGMVAGLLALIAITEQNISLAFFWLWLALLIDGIDGSFARWFRVSEVLPQVSGKTMDYVIDFANYAIIPAFLVYMAKDRSGQALLLPEQWRLFAAALILLVSALYYAKEGMVSKDYYFIGFPVMWNLVAFYLYYVFNLNAWWNFILILFFAALHFWPLKFLYPSRTKKFRLFNWLNTLVCMGSAMALLLFDFLDYQTAEAWYLAQVLAWLSLAYFGVLALYHTYFDADTKDLA